MWLLRQVEQLPDRHVPKVRESHTCGLAERRASRAIILTASKQDVSHVGQHGGVNGRVFALALWRNPSASYFLQLDPASTQRAISGGSPEATAYVLFKESPRP